MKLTFKKADPKFFQTLRQRTDAYFKQNNLKPYGDFRLYLKTIVFTLCFIAVYTVINFFTPTSLWAIVGLWLLLGAISAGIGFNVMHDGAHGSYSRKKWINDIMAKSLNVLGSNAFLWAQKHNINHHTFTNVEGMDDDIDLKPFFRVHKDQPAKKFHRFQHIYGLFLYGLTYFFWVFYRDFKKYFTKKIAENTPLRDLTFADHIDFWTSKILFFSIFIVVPVITTGWLNWAIGFAAFGFVFGLILAIVFQLAHIVEHLDFVTPKEETGSLENEWAVHQLLTTANFATSNKTLNWLLGGLNFQVEHHLFPRISHVHYPQINKIVKNTCQEYGIAYHEFPTMRSAFASHMRLLKTIGRAA